MSCQASTSCASIDSSTNTQRSVLTQSNEFYEAVIKQTADCIFLVDRATEKIAEANPALQHLLGYTADEFLELTLYDLFAHERESIDRSIQRIVDLKEHFLGERRFRRKDGGLVNLEVSVNLISYEGREVMCVVSRDLTERKQTEREMVRIERLGALGQMASGIAHDFNNLLSIVLGYSELLIIDPETLLDKEKAMRYLGIINTSAQDAAEVVRRLRGFYRYRATDEMFKPVDLNQLVQQAIPLTQPKWSEQALANGHTIHLQSDLVDIPPISGNEAELREVLTNLIFNAVDAIPGSGTITLRTYADNDHVVLEVSDTGSGMTDEIRQRCMEPFFSTKGEEGTGLGLGLVHGIIRRHEGTIDLETELEKGTTFIIRLPARQVADIPDRVDQPVETAAGPTLHVLVVDDEPPLCELISGYLSTDGHLAKTASNGREGLEKFLAGRFDVVVVDQAMPEMNGVQLASAIKQVTPDKPVILLTGFGDVMRAAAERPSGVDLIVSKPITLNQFREALVKVTKNNQS